MVVPVERLDRDPLVEVTLTEPREAEVRVVDASGSPVLDACFGVPVFSGVIEALQRKSRRMARFGPAQGEPGKPNPLSARPGKTPGVYLLRLFPGPGSRLTIESPATRPLTIDTEAVLSRPVVTLERREP